MSAASRKREEMTLTKGELIEYRGLKLIGWTEGDGSGHEGYNFADYFLNGVYQGPDEHGIEPIFEDASKYTIRTDASMQEIFAANIDKAAARFAKGEFPGVNITTADELLSHIEGIDGAWCWIESPDGSRREVGTEEL